jgi:hypothetical protein
VPLAAQALAQLPPRREGYPHLFGRRIDRGFSGWSKSKAQLDTRLPEPPPRAREVRYATTTFT